MSDIVLSEDYDEQSKNNLMAEQDERDNYRSLLRVIWETKPEPSKKPPLDLKSSFITQRIDCDEVYPGIFVGDENAAKCKEYLKSMGITHVLNTAQGYRIAQVGTNEKYYESSGIKFLGLNLTDMPETKINIHFDECAVFIDDALNNGGKVLVHCFMGISRSATIVLAYLMLRKGFTAVDAVRAVRKKRDISPNNGFLQQLCDLDAQLRKTSML